MTQPDDIRAMPAGRELDRAVAERVMGWRCLGQWTGEGSPDDSDWVGVPPGQVHAEFLPCCSTDIAAAWEVLGKFRDLGVRAQFADGRWWCEIEARPHSDVWRYGAGADAIPLAICRAALIATTDKEPRP